MLQLKNTTPFQAAIAVFPNENGVETVYVTVKASFELGNEVKIADTQQPIISSDEYWGEPGKSSLKYVGELHLVKPSTDIVMIGEAMAPDKRFVTQLDVAIAVANRKKVVRVFGDRQWTDGVVGLRITSPAPFQILPLVYERAFGGVNEADPENHEVLFEGRNPVGRGFKGKKSKKELKGTLLPNMEDPTDLITKPGDQPAPAGFGFVAPSWEPRKSYAGTYDETWQKQRAPYLPVDFDSRFFNAAHPDLIFDGYLKGGEPVVALNVSPVGTLKFNLPICDLNAQIRLAGKIESPPFSLETVLLMPSDLRLLMLWRLAMPCDKKALKIEQVELRLQRLMINGK